MGKDINKGHYEPCWIPGEAVESPAARADRYENALKWLYGELSGNANYVEKRYIEGVLGEALDA